MTAAAGVRWVEDWLLPQLGETRALDIAKIEPADTDRAVAGAELGRLARAGHRVRLHVVARAADLPADDEAFDVILCGGFGILGERIGRGGLVAAMSRALRPGGRLHLHVGNRVAPVDLTGNAPLLHGPRDRRLITLAEAEALFVGSGAFARVRPASPAGYQGWARLGALRPLGRLADALWDRVLTPDRRWLYASPFNPSLVLWIDR